MPISPASRRRNHQNGLFILLCLNALLSACSKPEAPSELLSGQVCRQKAGGKSVELSGAEVRVYSKGTFDAILLEVKQRAKEAKPKLTEAELQERERLEGDVSFREMTKERLESAKARDEKLFAQHLDAYADEFRKDLLSYAREIDAAEAGIEQDQKALKDLASKEGAAPQIPTGDELVRTVLKALPKPLLEIKSDEHGRFQGRLTEEGDYVVVTNATSEGVGDIEFYRTSVRPRNERSQSALLLSLYPWNADGQ